MTTIRIVQNFSNIKGPVKVNFVNSYWTFNTAQDQFVAGTTSARTSGESILPVIKQEVGPGEGPSILAVLLINEGFSSITGITSSHKDLNLLLLPKGAVFLARIHKLLYLATMELLTLVVHLRFILE